jgi:hypothetical protein
MSKVGETADAGMISALLDGSSDFITKLAQEIALGARALHEERAAAQLRAETPREDKAHVANHAGKFVEDGPPAANGGGFTLTFGDICDFNGGLYASVCVSSLCARRKPSSSLRFCTPHPRSQCPQQSPFAFHPPT